MVKECNYCKKNKDICQFEFCGKQVNGKIILKNTCKICRKKSLLNYGNEKQNLVML